MSTSPKIIITLIAIIVGLATALLYAQWGRWGDASLNQQFTKIQALVEDQEWDLVEVRSVPLIKQLNKMLDEDPTSEKNYEYWMMLGEVMLFNGEINSAVIGYKQALAIRPNDNFIASRLAQMQQISNRFQQGDNKPKPALVETESDGDSDGVLTASIAIAGSVDRKNISPDAVVFAYVRAYQGAPMPIAIKRLPITDFSGTAPTKVALTESNQMMQSGMWNAQQQYEWVVRISNSGNAVPQSGDIQGTSDSVKIGDSVTIEISQVIP